MTAISIRNISTGNRSKNKRLILKSASLKLLPSTRRNLAYRLAIVKKNTL